MLKWTFKERGKGKVGLPKGLEIKVSEDNIFDGIRKSGESCPIALAVRELFPEYVVDVELRVMRKEIRIGISGEWVEEYLLPPSAVDFIDAFDAGRRVEPLTFDTIRDTWWDEGELC
jgi:hypothetical protein